MPEFKTGVDNETLGEIRWQVILPWEVRREMHRRNVLPDDGVMGIQPDIITVIDIIFPACIAGWSRDEEITEETFWSIPEAHRQELGLQIGTYLAIGVNLSEVEGDISPLVGLLKATGYAE